MKGCLDSFDDQRVVANDGFGPVVEAQRDGRCWTIRTFSGISRRGIAGDLEQRLLRPPHPAILPVEVGPTLDGIYLAAPKEGRLLCALAREHGGTVVAPAQCAEIGIRLAQAACAVGAVGGGARLGPLSWTNVYLDPERPGMVWLFPLWITRTRSADWLRHSGPDLLFVDRDTLRHAPAPRSDVFSIAAIMMLLSRGTSGLPPVDDDASAVVRRAIIEGHPLMTAGLPDGELGTLVGRAIGQPSAGEPLDATGLAQALDAIRGAFDPMARALALHRAGRGLDAMRALHKSVQERGGTVPLRLLKAYIELDQKLPDRALRTLREAREASPASREVLALLGQHADAADEASEHYDRVVAADPLDAELRFAHALALERAGRIDHALQILDDLRTAAAADPSLARLGARAAVRMGRLVVEKHRHGAAAMDIVESYSADDDLELRAEALAVIGSSHAQQGSFTKAEQVLRDALTTERRARPMTPRPFVLNHLAHALVATGKRDEARELVMLSLGQDPDQAHLWRLLAALGG